jgi:hypothetical protein
MTSEEMLKQIAALPVDARREVEDSRIPKVICGKRSGFRTVHWNVA